MSRDDYCALGASALTRTWSLRTRCGSAQPLYAGTFARNYEDPPTETPPPGAIEAWRIFNTTGDSHPIYFHLVNACWQGVDAAGRTR